MAIEYSRGVNAQSLAIGAGLVGSAGVAGYGLLNRNESSNTTKLAEATAAVGLAGAAGYGLHKQIQAGKPDNISIDTPSHGFGLIGPKGVK